MNKTYIILLFQNLNLKDVLAALIPEKQKEVAAFRKEYGKSKVGEVTVDMVRIKLDWYSTEK